MQLSPAPPATYRTQMLVCRSLLVLVLCRIEVTPRRDPNWWLWWMMSCLLMATQHAPSFCAPLWSTTPGIASQHASVGCCVPAQQCHRSACKSLRWTSNHLKGMGRKAGVFWRCISKYKRACMGLTYRVLQVQPCGECVLCRAWGTGHCRHGRHGVALAAARPAGHHHGEHTVC